MDSGGKLDAKPPPPHFGGADNTPGIHTVSSVEGKALLRGLVSLQFSAPLRRTPALALWVGLAVIAWCSWGGPGPGRITRSAHADAAPSSAPAAASDRALPVVIKGQFRADANDPNRLRFLLRLQSDSQNPVPRPDAEQQGPAATATFRELVYEDGTIWHQLTTIETAHLVIHVIDTAVPPPRRLLVGSDGTWQTLATDRAGAQDAQPPVRWSRAPSDETVFVFRRTQRLIDPSRSNQVNDGLAPPCRDTELAALAQRKNGPTPPAAAASSRFPEYLTLPHPPVTPFFRLAEWVCLQVAST